MFFKKNHKETQVFYDLIHEAYNHFNISEELKKRLFEAAVAIDNKDNLSFVAYKLYPYIQNEVHDVTELENLKVYTERKKKKWLIGLISPTSLMGFRR